MGLRETIQKNPSLVSTAALGLIVLAVGLTFLGQSRAADDGYPNVYWTSDDGKTFFEDRLDLLPPHVNDKGVEQVRAFVFRDGPQGTPFVAYLMKYTPEGKAKLQEVVGSGKPLSEGLRSLPPQATLYKKPGTGNWIPEPQARAQGLLRVGGSEAVLPE